MMLCVWGGDLTIPFSVAIGFALRMTERTPLLSIAQLAMATFGATFFCMNFYFLFITPFRLDGSPAYTQVLHDIGFIFTFSPVQPFCIQYCFIGIAILADRNLTPIFPRWIGYLNLWVALLFVPATLIPFFKTGPFAWNGLLSFWVPVIVFFIWFAVMLYGLLRIEPNLTAD
jgi:hypothetical protein